MTFLLQVRLALPVMMLLWAAVVPASAQPPQPPPPTVKKVGDNLFYVGEIRVDTARHEISITGHVNDVTTLEFVANTRDGYKAYESALTLDTNGVTFNTALLLIGLDPAHSAAPAAQLGPAPRTGDPVEIWVEWQTPRLLRRIRAEELIWDNRAKQTWPEGPWVYTGSRILENGRYLADLDGVLIGFIHSPAAVIDSPRVVAIGAYGQIVRNPNLELPAGTPVIVTVKALGRPQGAGAR